MTTVLKASPVLALLLIGTAAVAQEAPSDATPTPEAQAAVEPAASAETPEATQTSTKSSDSVVPDSVAILTGSATGNARKAKFGGIVVLEQSLGLGTFVADEYARNPYYGWSLTLRPRYFFTNKLFAELRFSIQGELTESYTTSTRYKRQVMPSDLFLTLKYQNLYTIPVLKIALSPSLRFGAPTSYESRYRNLYLSGAAGLDMQRVFGSHFVLSYSFRFNKNFNETFTPTLDSKVAVTRFRGVEDAGGGMVINGVDNNTSYSVYNSLAATGIINDEWSITLVFGIQNSWTYANIAKDEFSSQYAKGGRGQRDSTFGTLDVTYQPFKHVGFSLGVSSAQPAKTKDNKSFRFPFFDFSTEGNNYTNFYFDVYATF
jgi:hypothetical protein